MKKILLIFVLLCGFSFPQNQAILIGKTELVLGSDRDDVLNLLDKSFYVEDDLKNDNIFEIWDSDKRAYSYGSVEFDKSNKLTTVNKVWSTAIKDGHNQIIEQMIKLIDSYKNNGDIKVETKEIFEPDYKALTLNFIQGKKVIELTVAGNRLTLKEILGE
jgi:hypothetical protein